MTQVEATLVKTLSPVEDKSSFLFHWDSSVRKHFSAFEMHLATLKQGVASLYTNPLTSFRDPVQFGHRYQEIATLKLRQQLGDISNAEVKEAGSVMSSQYSLTTARAGHGEPKKLYAYNMPLLMATLGFGGALGPYAIFVKGYNLLWLGGAMIPFLTSLVYNHSRQPGQHLQNCYSYILSKRQATVEMQQNAQLLDNLEITRSKEYKEFKSHLVSRNKTLYEYENDLVSKIEGECGAH